jgi:hypothetical protein
MNYGWLEWQRVNVIHRKGVLAVETGGRILAATVEGVRNGVGVVVNLIHCSRPGIVGADEDIPGKAPG